MSRSAFFRASAPFYDPSAERPLLKDNIPVHRSTTGDAWPWRAPGKGSVAQPSVDITFAGTTHHQKTDPAADLSHNKQIKKENDLLAEKNRYALEQAIFILSQSPTGRDVLEQMTKEGYKIVFDDKKTESRGAGGLCDPSDKTIILHSHDNAEYLALLIGHEAVHAVQNSRHNLFPTTAHKPEVGIRLSFAIEADAYAQQTQIALELAYGDINGHPDQLTFPGPLKQMRQRFPDIVKAAERIMTHGSAMQNGKTVTAAFQAFYDNFYLRTFYEDAHIDWASNFAPKLKGKASHLIHQFQNDTDNQFIKDRIRHRGIDYLNIHAPSLDFTDARHSGVSEHSHKRLKNFYNRHMPKSRQLMTPIFGIHMKGAVKYVLGLTNSTRAVFKKDTTPPITPPKLAPKKPRRRFWD